jgi:hypothetical protein
MTRSSRMRTGDCDPFYVLIVLYAGLVTLFLVLSFQFHEYKDEFKTFRKLQSMNWRNLTGFLQSEGILTDEPAAARWDPAAGKVKVEGH